MVTIQIKNGSMTMVYKNRFGRTHEFFTGTEIEGEDVIKYALEMLQCSGAGVIEEALYESAKAIA
jgi:hypothetical protein